MKTQQESLRGLSLPTKLRVLFYTGTRPARHFLWRIQIGYRAFKLADRLYGKGLVTALEFEGLSPGLRIEKVLACIVDADGKVKKPVVFP